MKRVVWSSVVVLFLMAAAAFGATLKVPSEYPSIQLGIEAAVDGDTVLVAPGVYYETINFTGKAITVTSTDPNDRGIVGYTIINADGDGSAVTFENGETSASVLTGFTITGGFGTLNDSLEGGDNIFWGGGIYCLRASPTITKNVIAGNRGPVMLGNTNADSRVSYGGGIACIESNATITHNVIRNNVGFAAGGLMLYIGQAFIANNIIHDNSAYVGGGVCLIGGTLLNNTIVGNNCNQGPGDGVGGNVYVIFEPQLGNGKIVNNIICNAPSGGGLLMRGDWQGAVISCNDVWGNTPGNYLYMNQQTGALDIDGTYNLTGKNGNISADPKFLGAVFSKDFHLVFESPCVNAGNPLYAAAAGAKDIDNQDRVYATRIDIGADEYVGYVKPVSSAGHDQHVLELLQTVTLDGGQSYFYDPEGVKTFRWTQVSGPTAALEKADAESPTFVPSEFGEYVFQLIVGDDQYESEPDSVLILVAPNHPPVANAGEDRICGASSKVTLNGTDSSDPDVVDRLTYQWTQVEGEPVDLQDADTASPWFVTEVSGQYIFELVVSDGFAQSEPSRVRYIIVSVTVKWQNFDAAPSQGYGPYMPDISGMRIAYVLQTTQGELQVVYKDMTTGKLETLASGSYSLYPKIDGDLIVWAGGISYNEMSGPVCSSVFVCGPSGVPSTLRNRSSTASYNHPAVSGRKVVWVQHVGLDRNVPEKWYNTPYDICGADLSNFETPVYFTVATNVGRRDPVAVPNSFVDTDSVVDISGDIVVWEGNGDIYAADLSDLNNIKIVTVCNHSARQYDPAISGRFVVWTDERNDSGDLYGADLSDFENIREFSVAKGPGSQQQAAIDGPLVAYVDSSLLGGGIKLAFITRNYGVLNADMPASTIGTMPALDGRNLIWLYSAYGTIQGMSLDPVYSIFDGRVQNARTGLRYDYLQQAVADANDGDEIIASQGVYAEKVDFAGKPVTIRSEDPENPAIVAATLLRTDASTVTFASQEEAGSVLAGFTVAGGSEGICCYSASPTITRCVVTGSRGPGIRLVGQCNPTVTHSQIIANGAAGIEMSSASEGRTVKQNAATIRNCLIAGNRAQGIRGGRPTTVNCTIVENSLEGIDAYAPTVINSILYFNRAANGAQIKSGRTVATYSDVQGGWEGEGNIDADPQFVSPGNWAGSVWTPGDYHLKSQGWRWDSGAGAWTSDDVTSPCIDAGDPTAELLDEPLTAPQGGEVVNFRIDMGYYGGTAQASLAPANQ
ncbi:MAG TPA: right-handed parallel beta-helix repeat-containing protein [Sedimentisphaerales bacterium]|nr:right-handed parallel beta-helix repeat-containing protein [Sedimentisphaerales bacterium]